MMQIVLPVLCALALLAWFVPRHYVLPLLLAALAVLAVLAVLAATRKGKAVVDDVDEDVVESFGTLVPTMSDDLKTSHHWVLLADQITKRAFPVLPTESKDRAAAMLGQISTSIERLIQFMQQRFPGHQGVKRLADRWDYRQLAEGKFDIEGVTSYTVNKGERIVLCMRNREGDLHHLNLVMFVLLHELAHIMSVSKSVTRHNEEFQQNLAFLLEHAKAIGVYESNVEGKSETYCGMPNVRIP